MKSNYIYLRFIHLNNRNIKRGELEQKRHKNLWQNEIKLKMSGKLKF